jgi:TatD DNase family protein
MIDVHCHLEQKDYEKDREKVIENSKKELKALITCCCHPEDFDLTLNLIKKHKNFIFGTFSIHPEYIKEISEKEIENFFERIEENKDFIVGIGETGLDYIIEEENFREKQKKLFEKFIQLAKDLRKPLVIHSRRAFAPAIEILERTKAKNVLMHFFTAKELLPKILKNGWSISVNTTLLNSKKIKKIVRDLPISQIMTETDSPWLGEGGKRNDPTSVRFVIKKIAEIKKMKFEKVDKITTENAISFFKLPLRVS